MRFPLESLPFFLAKSIRVVCFDHKYVCRSQQNASSISQAPRNRFASSSEPPEVLSPNTPSEAGSSKKSGLMHRLFAKVHRGDQPKSSGQSYEPEQNQESQSDLLRKGVRRVSIVDDSKENIPSEPVNTQATTLRQSPQDRSILSSSLPTTPAESAMPSMSRRSSACQDHHLQAFEASAPGRLALSIDPQLGEVKGRSLMPSQSYIAALCHVMYGSQAAEAALGFALYNGTILILQHQCSVHAAVGSMCLIYDAL